MSNKHIIARNSIYNLTGQAVQVGTALLLIPFIIARLDMKLYGIWAILSAMSNYQGLLDFGATYIKYIAEYKAKEDWAGLKSIISTGFYITLFTIAIIFLLGYVFRDRILSIFINDPATMIYAQPVFSIALISFGLSYLVQFFQSILGGYQRMELKNLTIIIQRITNFFLIIIMLNNNMGLYGVFLAGIISWTAVLLLNLYQIKKVFKLFSLSIFSFSKTQMRALLSFGWKMQITTFGGWIYNNVDKLFLGHFADLTVVSIYDIACKIRNLTRIPVTAYTGSIIPAASEIVAISHLSNVKKFYERHNKYLLLIVFPVNFFIFVNARGLINLWVGQGFEKAALILQILTVGNTVNLLTGVGSSIARGINKPGIEARYSAIVAFIILFFGYFAAKYYGLVGLSICSSLAIGVPSFWFIILMNDHLKVNNLKYIYEIIWLPLISITAISLFDYLLGSIIVFNPTDKILYGSLFMAKLSIYFGLCFLILKRFKYIDLNIMKLL